MSDQYLWNRSGPPDPDVERLEALLAPLRSTPPVPDLTALPRTTSLWSWRYLTPAFAAAAAIVLMIGSTWQSTRGAASWTVARVDGQPRIGSAALADTGHITVGQTLVTDTSSR